MADRNDGSIAPRRSLGGPILPPPPPELDEDAAQGRGGARPQAERAEAQPRRPTPQARTPPRSQAARKPARQADARPAQRAEAREAGRRSWRRSRPPPQDQRRPSGLSRQACSAARRWPAASRSRTAASGHPAHPPGPAAPGPGRRLVGDEDLLPALDRPRHRARCRGGDHLGGARRGRRVGLDQLDRAAGGRWRGRQPFDIEEYAGTSRVLGFTMIVAVIDVILITAIATLGAFLYNLVRSPPRRHRGHPRRGQLSRLPRSAEPPFCWGSASMG